MSEYSYAKPARYNGTLYRSWTEAGWACVLNKLRVNFEYETRTFVLPDGSEYTSDFYLGALKRYVEVKNGNREMGRGSKAVTLARHLDREVFLIDGLASPVMHIFDSTTSRVAEPARTITGQRPVVHMLLQEDINNPHPITGLQSFPLAGFIKGIGLHLDLDVSAAECAALDAKLLDNSNPRTVL